ncbi:MAG: hypothetical protein M3015_03895 [Bacteroidota bacterium]|nr:hypothetical protein [Bacteroidota bacterium]
MQNFKDKLFNYEANPPKNIWDNIAFELDAGDKKVIQMPGLRKRSRFLFYGLTAAASLIIIFLSSLFFEKTGKKNDEQTASSVDKIYNSPSKLPAKDSLNNVTLEGIIKSSKNKSTLAQKQSQQKKYITIAGPGGQPIKISSKVATLIVSADNDYPPKPVWDKKINKWKQIMLSSTLSPTATNLLDIAELSSMRGDN